MSLNFDPTTLAATVAPPTRMMIGGRSVESASGTTFCRCFITGFTPQVK